MQITKNFFESKTGKSILSMNIRNKISITSAILLALCLLFFTSLITYDQKKKNYKELELNAERITDLIAYTNTENLLNLNYGGLKKNSDYFFKDTDIASITITDNNGTILVDLKKYIKGDYNFSSSADIIHEGNIAGRVQVSFSSNYRDHYIDNTRKKTGIIFLLILILTTTCINLTAKKMLKPLKDITDAVNHLSKNNFTAAIQIKSLDEIGKIALVLNHATENLNKIFSSVKTSMEHLHKTIEQINGTNQVLVQRTSDQASSIDKIVSSVDETKSLVHRNSESSINASDTSKASLIFAEKGNELVNSAVVSINEIKNSSRKIGDITSVINEIAFQTNLLALNAAVEAARAGNQGRGFAVVASEVRNLAQRSGSAAKEINKLITESIQKIEKGTSQANESGEAIKHIVESVRNVTNLLIEITASTYEQRSGIKQLDLAINKMYSTTQQNLALVNESASASETLSDIAKELADIISIFKTSDLTEPEEK